jgi:Mn-dependent DtxR family transcriptional regulator
MVKAKKAELLNMEKRVLQAVRHLEANPNAVSKRGEIAKRLRIRPGKAQATLFRLRELGLLKVRGVKGGAYWIVR